MSRFSSSARATPVEVGRPAPSFRLRRTFDEDMGLEDLIGQGPALLAFYVFDFGHV